MCTFAYYVDINIIHSFIKLYFPQNTFGVTNRFYVITTLPVDGIAWVILSKLLHNKSGRYQETATEIVVCII